MLLKGEFQLFVIFGLINARKLEQIPTYTLNYVNYKILLLTLQYDYSTALNLHGA